MCEIKRFLQVSSVGEKALLFQCTMVCAFLHTTLNTSHFHHCTLNISQSFLRCDLSHEALPSQLAAFDSAWVLNTPSTSCHTSLFLKVAPSRNSFLFISSTCVHHSQIEPGSKSENRKISSMVAFLNPTELSLDFSQLGGKF